LEDKKEQPVKWSILLKKITAIVIVIGPSFYFGALDKPTEMGIAVAAGAIATCFLFLDEIEFFKGAGFEARTKKEVEKVVDEATATIDNLRNITTPLLTATINSLAFANRWGGMDPHSKHKLKTELEKVGTSLNINSPELQEAFNSFNLLHTLDHLKVLSEATNKTFGNSHQVAKSLSICVNDWRHKLPDKTTLIAIFEPISSQLLQEHKDLIDDYLYYIEHHQLRRIETLERS